LQSLGQETDEVPVDMNGGVEYNRR